MRALIAWALAALVCWTAFVQWLAPAVPAIPLASLQNAVVAERLAATPAPALLVLGSSLTARLPMTTVDAGAQAVGISGGSAPAAIALVQALGRQPRVAVVETNRLSWTSDSTDLRALVADARRRVRWRVLRTEFRPSTQAIGALVRVSDAVRAALVSEATMRASEHAAAASYGRADGDSVLAGRALGSVRAVLDSWRAAGTAVYLVELPVHPLVETAAWERRMIERLFPDTAFPRIAFGGGDWPTTDGRHLERVAAARAARAIMEVTRPVRSR